MCYDGSLDQPSFGPEKTTCEALYIKEHIVVPENGVFSWHYVQCPLENECENGHHNCDNTSEQCVDLVSGYQCVCGQGYKSENSECVPVSTFTAVNTHNK